MNDIEIIKLYHGLTTEQAKIYKTTIKQNTIDLMRKEIENEAKKAFYND